MQHAGAGVPFPPPHEAKRAETRQVSGVGVEIYLCKCPAPLGSGQYIGAERNKSIVEFALYARARYMMNMPAYDITFKLTFDRSLCSIPHHLSGFTPRSSHRCCFIPAMCVPFHPCLVGCSWALVFPTACVRECASAWACGWA